MPPRRPSYDSTLTATTAASRARSQDNPRSPKLEERPDHGVAVTDEYVDEWNTPSRDTTPSSNDMSTLLAKMEHEAAKVAGTWDPLKDALVVMDQLNAKDGSGSELLVPFMAPFITDLPGGDGHSSSTSHRRSSRLSSPSVSPSSSVSAPSPSPSPSSSSSGPSGSSARTGTITTSRSGTGRSGGGGSSISSSSISSSSSSSRMPTTNESKPPPSSSVSRRYSTGPPPSPSSPSPSSSFPGRVVTSKGLSRHSRTASLDGQLSAKIRGSDASASATSQGHKRTPSGSVKGGTGAGTHLADKPQGTQAVSVSAVGGGSEEGKLDGSLVTTATTTARPHPSAKASKRASIGGASSSGSVHRSTPSTSSTKMRTPVAVATTHVTSRSIVSSVKPSTSRVKKEPL